MHRSIAVSAFTLFVLASARTSDAQTCLGRPYFSTGRFQIGAGAEFGNNATVIGGDASMGKDHALFGRVSVAHETSHPGGESSSGDPSGMVFGGGVGYQLALGKGGHAQICPMVSGDWGKLDLPGDLKLKRSHVQVGATVGLATHSNADLHIVPFAGIAVAQFSRDIDASLATESLATDSYFPLTAGVGLHFKSSFMIIGDVTVPIDLGGYDPAFGIRVVIPFGGKR